MPATRITASVTGAARPARPRRWPAALAWALWALALIGLATVPWFDHLMRQAGRPDLIQLNASTIPYLLALVIAPTVGAVLAGRRPRHPVGWLLLALGLSVSASGFADGYARYGVAARPGAVPAARWVAIYSPATTILGLVCVGFILLLTPTGSLPSPRWRWWAWVEAAGGALFVAAATFGPLLIPPYESVHKPLALPSLESAMVVVTVLAFGITIGGLAVGAASLVVRFRRARGVERLQLRWLALAAAVTGVLAAVVLVGFAVGATAVPLLAAGICMAILPLATGAGRRLPASPGPRPAGGRPALQPPPLRRGRHHPGVRRTAAPAGRPRCAASRAAGGRRPDHAAHQDLALAATTRRRLQRGRPAFAADHGRGRSHRPLNQARGARQRPAGQSPASRPEAQRIAPSRWSRKGPSLKLSVVWPRAV